MKFSRIEGDVVAEIPSMNLDNIPEHKRNWWRPIEGEPPAYDPHLETISGPTLVIEPTRVVRTWTVTRRPLDEQKLAVKAEARRRILERYPDWRQTNMVARGVELQDIWRTVGSWTAAEQAEADALKASWSWIKSVRAASDAIEAMAPIPADYTADSYWPA
jgi:hypothetical protein